MKFQKPEPGSLRERLHQATERASQKLSEMTFEERREACESAYSKFQEVNGKFVPPEDCGSEIRKDMTIESVQKACEAARDARVKRFKLQESEKSETRTEKTPEAS